MIRAIAFLLSLLIASQGAFAGDPLAPRMADPSATQGAKNVLTYLQNVGRRTTHRVVIGQEVNGNSSNVSSDYAAQWTSLYTATGLYAGLAGYDFGEWNASGGGGNLTAATYNAQIAYMEAQWAAGSLIEISYHANNPFLAAGSDWWSTTGCNGGSLADLVNPSTTVLKAGTSTTVYTAWHNQLAAIAGYLQTLQAAGVPIIWRPLMEQNNNNWWFVTCNTNMSQFQALWQDMFTYLTVTQGVHNLLWAFSSNGPIAGVLGCAGVSGEGGLCIYPGSAYVDLVGLDEYHDTTYPMPSLFTDNWIAWSSLGKPVAYTERGPNAGASDPNNIWANVIPGVIANGAASVPTVAYVMSWFPLSASSGASTVMNDPNAANQSDVKRALDCMATATNYTARVACMAL